MPSSRSKSAKMSALELISSAKPPENYAMISDLQQMCSNENGTDLLSHRTPDQGGIVLQPLKEELDVIESHPCREERTEILVKIESDDAGTAAQSFQEVNAQNREDNLLSVANETSSSQGTVLMDNTWISSGARPKVTKAVDSLLNESDSTNSIRTFPLTRTLSSDSKLHFPPSCDQNSETSSKNLPLLLEEHVKIAFVESPSLFYVQRSVDFSWIVSLGHKLNRIAREEPRTVETVPLVGKLYICCFTADEKWYRALALSVLPDSQEVVVEYVDYGNNETIKTSRLRECPPPYQLENLPPFCMACSLWEIIPARGDCWDAEAVEIFCDLVKDISLQLYVIDCETVQDTNKCLVDLRRPGRTVGIANDLPLSIREVLIFLGYGIYVNKSPQDQYKKKMTPMRSYHRPELPFGKCDTEVLVCHVKSPNEFYLQLKSNCDCLTSLMNELQSHYNSPSIVGNLDWHIFAPKIGMLCVAKYSGDEKWYRAIIVDLPGYRKVDVFYVDFGNQERLWYKQVNKVADRFALLPMQAVPCSLLDIEPCGERWVPNIAVLMTGILESQKILVMFHSYEDEKALVNLSAQSDACKIIDCGDRLIQMGLAKSSFKRHKKLHSKKLGSQKWTQVDVKNGVQKQETLAEVKERGGYISRSKEDVTCLAVTSPSCIHLRLTSISTAFKELQGKLIQEMQNITSSNISPEIGDVCIARCKPSGYARVKVLEVTDEEFLVHFVDCGGIQKIKQADLFKLPEGLAEIKPLSLSVRLADIIPPGGQMAWPGITKDCLEELLSSKDILYMTPQGDAEQHPDFKIEVIPAYVEFTEEKLGGPFEANSVSFVSVNELLIQEGLALPCQVRGHSPAQSRPYSEEERTSEIPCVSSKRELTTPDLNDAVAQKERDQSMPSYDEANISRYPSGWIPCELPESTVFVAYPSYVDDHATIYLQPLKNMGTLLTMSEAFSILVANSLPSDDDLCWSIGDPVIARFFIDNKWHRATVLKLLEKGNVLVQFVDYGNTDVVMLSDLRRSIVYDQVPIQCYKAVLYQTEPRNMQGCWQTEVLDFLHKSVVEKECLVTVMEKPRPGEPLQVRLLVKEHNLDVISLLVNKMKVCRIVKPMLSLEEDSCDVVVEDETNQMDFPVVNLPSLSLPNNPFEKFRVKVTAIKDPASVYISPVFSNGTAECECLLQSSVAAYQSFFSLVNSNPSPYARVKDPQIGEIYLGMFSTEEWYRVQIIAKTQYQITAMFVDTGNLEDIAIKNLRECPEIGLNIPAMAVGVKLHQVVPPNQSRNMWSEEAMRAMIDCLMNTNEKSFLTSVKSMESPPQVELYLEGTEKLAYADLITSGLVAIQV
ncbi:RING finger protein 17-like [Macrobrachium rosenbergii]|uniref:RING finger protein 17-like n=1 Tax=Macrobrachium rosenbergii TaxID=79674 RepID=UPI0034D709A9